MKTIYKKCDDCDGKGYFFMPYPEDTTVYPLTINQPLVMSESIKCNKCNGTGRIEIAYIDEP